GLTAVPQLRWVLAAGAITAMLGVLLNLVLGLSRVWLAMGRRGDMPTNLANVSEVTKTPVPAVVLTGLVIAVLVLLGDVKTTWTFSAFTVLVYYAITNAAALRLAPADRLYPRFFSWAGLVACVGLAFFVPWQVWAAGLGLLALGLAWHLIRRRTLPGSGLPG
ncbi:MAG: amino acid permease, partial [Phycisphaerae bacterium]